MRVEKRVGFLFLIIGLALVAVSFTGYAHHTYGPVEEIEGTDYFGYVFGSGGSFHLEANSWNSSKQFSLYLLTLDDTLTLIEEISISNTTPLLEFHGVTHINQAVLGFPPGKYGVVAISDDGSKHSIPITVRVLHPFPEVLITGLVSMGIGVIAITVSIGKRKIR